MKERVYKFDNLKLLLITLVVYGHILEFVPASMDKYIFIYTFHMPCFMFVTGYFAKFDKWNIILKLVYPYFLFQTLYNYFETIQMSNPGYQHTYVVPYWIMWYLLTVIFYYILIPLFDDDNNIRKILLFIGVLFLSVELAKDVYMGYYFSSARTLYFMPFFLAGFYVRDSKIYGKLIELPLYIKICYLIVVKILTDFVLDKNIITHMMLFGSLNYQTGQYTPRIKLIIYIMAFAWIVGLVLIMPNIKIPFITTFGKGTFSVFLLHGFVVKLLHREVIQNGLVLTQSKALIISICLVILFGNPFVSKAFDFVCTGKWIMKVKSCIEKKQNKC